MSRREEVEAQIRAIGQFNVTHESCFNSMLTLADEVDTRDAIIDKLLAMMIEEAGDEPVAYTYPEDPRLARWQTITELHARACEIAGRVK